MLESALKNFILSGAILLAIVVAGIGIVKLLFKIFSYLFSTVYASIAKVGTLLLTIGFLIQQFYPTEAVSVWTWTIPVCYLVAGVGGVTFLSGIAGGIAHPNPDRQKNDRKKENIEIETGTEPRLRNRIENSLENSLENSIEGSAEALIEDQNGNLLLEERGGTLIESQKIAAGRNPVPLLATAKALAINQEKNQEKGQGKKQEKRQEKKRRGKKEKSFLRTSAPVPRSRRRCDLYDGYTEEERNYVGHMDEYGDVYNDFSECNASFVGHIVKEEALFLVYRERAEAREYLVGCMQENGDIYSMTDGGKPVYAGHIDANANVYDHFEENELYYVGHIDNIEKKEAAAALLLLFHCSSRLIMQN